MDELNNTTEKQIYEAALKIFQKKGFAGARMQEIADEAKINKSMLHYYFRSKEKLFREIFLSSMKQLLSSVVPILNSENTWEQKIPLLINHYVDFIEQNPDLPFFVLNEMRNNTKEFLGIVKIDEIVMNSLFLKQLKEAMQKGEIRTINPAQILLSLISGVVFPFIARPMVTHMVQLNDSDWTTFMKDRRQVVEDMVIGYLKNSH
ncbi:MAG TPA: TetR/AcrR family transcriptional regulator [Mucilaginibacter sp.]|jgi:AcrR family transcriptional regulator